VSAGWRGLVAVMATATLAGASLSLLFPLGALVMQAAGWSAALIGANAAMHGLGIFLVAPSIDRLLQALGAVRCLQMALLVGAVGTLLLPLSVEPLPWFLLRLVLGAASGLLFVISEAAVNALVPEDRRGRVIGIYAALFCVGYAAGPLVVAVAGHRGWLPFALAAGLLALGLVPATLAVAADHALAGDGSRRRRVAPVLRRSPLPFAAILVFGLVEASFFGLLPLWGLTVGLAPGDAALLLSVWIAGNIVLQIPLGWLADRLGRRRLLLVCVALSVATLALLDLAADGAGLWPLLLLMGGTMGGLYTLSLALLGQAFRGPELGLANTAFFVAFEIGCMAGPALAGAGMQALGGTSLPWLVALPLLALLLAAPRLRAATR
jgi:MFS family permease